MADVVLVHGTTQNAAGFAGLVEALHELGHRVMAVEVPSGTATSAANCADLVCEQLPPELDSPVVAAHSASGLFLPHLAERLNARHQVWIAGVVADYKNGRSFRTELLDDPGVVVSPEWLGVDPTADPVLATYFLFHDADLLALQRALPTVALCDLAALYDETPDKDPTVIPSTYLLPTGDRAFRTAWMDGLARERLGIEPVRLDGGHNLYAGQARAVALAINQSAGNDCQLAPTEQLAAAGTAEFVKGG